MPSIKDYIASIKTLDSIIEKKHKEIDALVNIVETLKHERFSLNELRLELVDRKKRNVNK